VKHFAFALFLSAFFIQSCLHPDAGDVSIDETLISDKSGSHPFPGKPYFVHFKNGDKNLFYIAAFHEKEASSKTFELINKAFQKYKLSCVLIEGLSFQEGESPRGAVDYARKTSKGNLYEGGEGTFTLLKATEKGIPFFGAEPPGLNELRDDKRDLGFRDRYIVGVIEESVNRYKSVFIVYGSGHLAIQRKALETAFGKPVLETDNLN
jgi:hypothetical protein